MAGASDTIAGWFDLRRHVQGKGQDAEQTRSEAVQIGIGRRDHGRSSYHVQ